MSVMHSASYYTRYREVGEFEFQVCVVRIKGCTKGHGIVYPMTCTSSGLQSKPQDVSFYRSAELAELAEHQYRRILYIIPSSRICSINGSVCIPMTPFPSLIHRSNKITMDVVT